MLDGFLLVLVLALATLPAAGNLLGGAISELVAVSDRHLSLALHLAAGIVLAVVGLELIPEALTAAPACVPIVAFVAGSAAFIGLDRMMGFIQGRLVSGEQTKGPFAILSGVSLDLFSDGVMIGRPW